MNRSLRVVMAAAVAVGVVTLPAGRAEACCAFAPVDCIHSAYITQIWRYQVGGGTGVWELPSNPQNGNEYINRVYNTRFFVANRFVRDVRPGFQAFNTEAGYDFFQFNRVGSAPISLDGDRGALVPFRAIPTAVAASLQSTPLYMIFKSDHVVTAPGFSIEDLALTCSGDDNGTSPVGVGQRMSGILLAENDVVLMRHFRTAASADTTVAVWGESGQDIDLYMRCGAEPTTTQFDFRGFSSNDQEFIHIPASACPLSQAMYLAVHAYSYSDFGTWFNLIVHEHAAGYHGAGLVAKTVFDATPAAVSDWGTRLQRGLRGFYGATEGAFFWDAVEVRNNTGSGEVFKLHSDNGRGNSGLCTGVVNLYANSTDLTVTHECGHRFACLRDEYNDTPGSPSHCGHSIMGNYNNSPMNKNLCYCNSWTGTACPAGYGVGDHLDGSDAGAIELQPPSWNVVPAVNPPPRPSTTPDNYDFASFDFNNLYAHIGVVP